jgi:hypothetical protein
VPSELEHEARRQALCEFLERRTAEGFRIETQTDTHAIIVSPRRLNNLLGLRKRGRPRRQVVSVDEHAVVSTEVAEPIRW